MRRLGTGLAAVVLATSFGGVLLAPFLAPYSPGRQFRDASYAPPSLQWTAAAGDRHLWPGVESPQGRWQPLHLMVAGDTYRWFGFQLRTHLFGMPEGDRPVFVLGTDSLGRDIFSRILFGARFSLSVGLLGIILALLVGLGAGLLAGYLGGWVDVLLMRLTDLFLSLPALMLILGIRAVFPLELGGDQFFWLMAVIFALISWSSIARVIRGQVLSLKTREYVLAATTAGASHWRILSRHILPFTTGFLVVQASVLLPAFVLGEITLSFLGVGVQEPAVSWGTLLAAANSISVAHQYPWVMAPAAVIFVTLFGFALLGDHLKAVGRVRFQWW